MVDLLRIGNPANAPYKMAIALTPFALGVDVVKGERNTTDGFTG